MNTFREAGLSLGRLPVGKKCAITDVSGVQVGHRTIVRGEGEESIRTGVTAILPPGDPFAEPLPAGLFVLHGHGKAVGLWQILHLGTLETPILLTNTLAVFRCAEALITWTLRQHPEARSINPVVLECNDGFLSRIESRPVTEEDALAAIGSASEEVVEGCVGAGAGMVAFGLKSGIGTASRLAGPYTVGALALPNMGRQDDLRFLGRQLDQTSSGPGQDGSVIIVLATNAPLLPEQLSRLARRGALGLARTGAPSDPGSGDFLVAFSTCRGPCGAERVRVEFVPDRSEGMRQLYRAAAEVTEEAVLSALLAAETTEGRKGRVVPVLPRYLLNTVTGDA
jgi:D-aminopeptidase